MGKHSEFTLKKQDDFKKVYNRGKSKISNSVVVLYYENRKEYVRTAFVASKKVSNKSVKRNRARRIMKAAYGNIEKKVVPGYDIVFVARNNIIEKNSKEVERAMFGAMKAAGLLKK